MNPDPDLNSDPEIDISKCSRANGDLLDDDDLQDEEQSIGTLFEK